MTRAPADPPIEPPGELFPQGSEITQAVRAMRDGDPAALDRVVSLLYDDLRRVARSLLLRSRPGVTLRTTALVHEVYLRLASYHGFTPADRGHFLAVVARAMRQIIVSYARRHGAAKRGYGRPAGQLEDAMHVAEGRAEEVLAIHEALEGLAAVDERLVRVVECRFFSGLSEEETAEAVGVSVRTVQRDWLKARVLLSAALQPKAPTPGGEV